MLLSLGLLLMGCSPEEPTSTPLPDQDSGVVRCEVDALWPPVGAEDIHPDTQPFVAFTEAVQLATVTAELGSGRAVSGQAAIQGGRVRFTPNEPLERGARVVVTFDACDRETRTSFTVSGEESGPTELLGTSWELDVSDGTVALPAGEFVGFTPGEGVWRWTVIAEDDEGFDVELARLDDGVQDCEVSTVHTERSGDLFTAPLDAQAVGSAGSVSGQARGTLRDDGLVGVEVVALWDLRSVGEDDATCALIEGFGIECEPCPDGELGCIKFAIGELTVPVVEDAVEGC
ncbi:MAG: Ig-like domain-containing protein [Proteobacteria bacterium]|nr:Ig-like domain-containing protein [Pseudomonadota bacterium]MCP4915525.1 Ig-like domain-containing protein [Pseudomonadota bacterium]